MQGAALVLLLISQILHVFSLHIVNHKNKCCYFRSPLPKETHSSLDGRTADHLGSVPSVSLRAALQRTEAPTAYLSPWRPPCDFTHIPTIVHTAPRTKLHRVPSSAACLTGSPHMLCTHPSQSRAVFQMGIHTAPWRLLIQGFLHSFTCSFSHKPHTGTQIVTTICIPPR